MKAEDLFDAKQQEKKKPDLQTLPDGFFMAAVELYQKIRQEDSKKKELPQEERYNASNQIRRMIKDLHDIRQDKIAQMAKIQGRLNSNIVDLGALTDYEKKFYDRAVQLLQKHHVTALLDG